MFRIINVLTAIVSLLTSVYLLQFVSTLLQGADKLYLEATMSKKIINSMYPPNIRERLLRRGSGSLANLDADDVDGFEYGVEDNVKSKRIRPSGSPGNLLGRISRSDSMQFVRKRIHDFVQRRRRSDELEISAESEPIADNFNETSIMFADISNFTFWSSNHTPIQVFTLLESLFLEFDQIASQMEVYKLATVGDCYIAVTGVPYPQKDHAVVLAQFAERCRRASVEVIDRLSKQYDDMDGMSKLKIRIGIHSGPVTAGVLRGNKARFDLFGDTINTASRIESTGEPGRIHLSRETAELLEQAERGDWLVPRDKSVMAKGKGELKTFWLDHVPIDNGCVMEATVDIEMVENRLKSNHDRNDPIKRGISELEKRLADVV